MLCVRMSTNVPSRVLAIYVLIVTIIPVTFHARAIKALQAMASPVQIWMNASFRIILVRISLYVSTPLEPMFALV